MVHSSHCPLYFSFSLLLGVIVETEATPFTETCKPLRILHKKPNDGSSSYLRSIWCVLGPACWRHMAGLGQRSVVVAPLRGTPYGRYKRNMLKQGVPTS